MMHLLFFHVTLEKALHFPNKGEDDFVEISGMRSLKAFTVCLWMSSSDTQGTPFNYATTVSDSGNELVIEFREHFSLVIDGQHR